MNINRMTIKINYPGILAFGFLVVFFCAKSFSMPDMLANGLIAFMGLLCFAYVLIKNRVSSWCMLTGIILSMLMLISILFNGNASYFEILWVWCYLGVALILTQFEISSKTLSFVFIVIALIFGFQIVAGVNAQDAIGSGSGNNISTYVLFYVMLIYMKRFEEQKSVIYWPSIVALALSVWGNGRAGILACGVMFVLVFLYDYIFVKKAKISTLVKVSFLVVIAVFVVNAYFGDYIAALMEKMDRYGYSSVRTEMWAEYVAYAFNSVGAFFIGVPTMSSDTPLLAHYSGNTHNAFLMLHAKFGLFGFLYVLVALLNALGKFCKRKEYIYLIMFAVWFVRSMFDWTGFPGIFDVIFFYFVIRSKDDRGAMEHRKVSIE